MKATFFNHVRFRGDWEFNFHLGRYCLRVGRTQVAFWRDYEPLFMWIRTRALKRKLFGE